MNNKIIKFPSIDKRPKHIYKTKACAGCQRKLIENEIYNEIILTSNDGMEKEHIALCNDCNRTSEYYGVFD